MPVCGQDPLARHACKPVEFNRAKDTGSLLGNQHRPMKSLACMNDMAMNGKPVAMVRETGAINRLRKRNCGERGSRAHATTANRASTGATDRSVPPRPALPATAISLGCRYRPSCR